MAVPPRVATTERATIGDVLLSEDGGVGRKQTPASIGKKLRTTTILLFLVVTVTVDRKNKINHGSYRSNPTDGEFHPSRGS